jgi:hypothetical protein
MMVDMASAFPPEGAKGRGGGAAGFEAVVALLGGSTVKRFWQWWHFTRNVVVGKRVSSTLKAAPQCLQKMIISKPRPPHSVASRHARCGPSALLRYSGPLGDFRYSTPGVKEGKEGRKGTTPTESGPERC